MNTSINQAHLQLDNGLLNTDLTAASSQLSMSTGTVQLNGSMQSNELNTSANCTIPANSIATSVKIEQQPFNSTQAGSAIHSATSQNQPQNYPLYQLESNNNNYSQLEDRKVDTLNVSNCRTDCSNDCKPNLLCNHTVNRQSSIDSYSSSDSFNLLHNALSTSNDSSNQNVNTATSNSIMHNNSQLTNSTTTKRNRSKRSQPNWSNNQKLNNSLNQCSAASFSNTLGYIKSDPAACSPPSMIPTPPMENTLNCSTNQLNSNLVQSPLINNDLTSSSTADFYLLQQQQQQSRSSILSASLQSRLNGNNPTNINTTTTSGYPSMELINHRRAYPSPTSSTASSAYMSPTSSQTLNHSPNSNFTSSTTSTEQTKFLSHSLMHANNVLSNQLPNQTSIYHQSQVRMDQSNNVFLYNSNNQPIQQSTAAAATNLPNDNQTSFNCESNNTPTVTKTYTNQCLSTSTSIYNGIEQATYAQQQANSSTTTTTEQSTFGSQSHAYSTNHHNGSTNAYLPNQQFVQQQPNANYQQTAAGYFNNSQYSTVASQPQQHSNHSSSVPFNFDAQQYSTTNAFLNNSTSSSKNDLFYGGENGSYHTGTTELNYPHSGGHLMNGEFNNDYYTDSIYNVCQPFSGDNFNAQDYQQLS